MKTNSIATYTFIPTLFPSSSPQKCLEIPSYLSHIISKQQDQYKRAAG